MRVKESVSQEVIERRKVSPIGDTERAIQIRINSKLALDLFLFMALRREGCVYHLGSRGGPRSSSKAVNTRPGGQIGLTPWARGENNA